MVSKVSNVGSSNRGNKMQIVKFETPEAFFDAFLGPMQHDRHVEAFRRHHQQIADRAWAIKSDEHMRKCNAEWIAARRARIVS